MIIAISGPAASGKGTLARMLAKEIGLPHYDFGLMFRAIAFSASKFGVDKTFKLAKDRHLYIEGEDMRLRWVVLTTTLRSEEIGLLAARIANYNLPRILKIAQAMVAHESFVCDGRTCGSEIYPHAKFKFFIIAAELERLNRRFIDGGNTETFLKREILDKSRLKIPEGAIIIDTTGKTKEESLREILSFLK